MKLLSHFKLALILLAMGSSVISMAVADQVIQYQLDPEMVSRAELLKGQKKPTILIQLNEQETARLADLTRNNVGLKIKVLFDDKILVEATVRAEIDSGTITSRMFDESEATMIVRGLNSR